MESLMLNAENFLFDEEDYDEDDDVSDRIVE